MKDFLSDKIKSWVIYIFYGIFILTYLNTCNSCSRNKETKQMRMNITSLNNKVDSLSNIINTIPTMLDESYESNLPESIYLGIALKDQVGSKYFLPSIKDSVNNYLKK